MKLAFNITDNTSYSLAMCSQFCGIETYFWKDTVPVWDVIDIFKPNIVFASKPLSDSNKTALTKSKIDIFDMSNVPYFGNLLTFKPTPPDDDYLSEFFYLSDNDLKFLGDRLKNVLKFTTENKKRIKIVGRVKIETPEYLGVLAQISSLNKLIASTKIVLDCNNTIIYNAALSKKFCIQLTNQNTLFPSIQSLDCDETANRLSHYLNSPREREEIAEKAYNFVITGHTEFHRLANLLTNNNKEDLAQKVLDTLCKIS